MEPVLPLPKPRIHSIDILRGIIMVLMALDHTRDFFSNAAFDPLDLDKTTAAYYLTRWVTHLCAPTFIFLSGASAYLSSQRKTSRQTSSFLLSRGLWLIFLELTVVNFGWMFDPGFHLVFAQVIWAIGFSMIFLAALVYLKPLHIGIIGLALIFGHNLFDGIKSASWGQYKFFWMFLHEQNLYVISKTHAIMLLYPVVPWCGVMAAGYAFGTLFQFDPAGRQRLFIQIGLCCILLFLLLRLFNIYGDPRPWAHQHNLEKDAFDMMNVQKYPPSLAYLLITLGISIAALGLLEFTNNGITKTFTTYGRVPMFYYVLHIYLLHLAALFTAMGKHTSLNSLTAVGLGPQHGFSLPVIYLIWLSVVILLYFPCYWFMKVKQRRRDWWLSYV
ncbi:putative membrane protein [Mucilaginibacter yixingensis]|uniref:Putative membrane protein n=1 Tax=Mucilaginibacter yixingensis TaxID=1295612 RepID=A0A2T5JDZ2_9SPHI|nr:heparan-alpha-glucosaminide N-acetyltransferase domain-containing protein [Mucilaginibacter yixingensis]PTQ99973.1 putative membrane protein [Mucilaginibacter yixingensis]